MATKGFNKMHVSKSGRAMVATGWNVDWSESDKEVSGEVSATEMREKGHWYLNRAFVGPEASRGKGLGTFLLKRLLAELENDPAFIDVVVEPGGYHTDLAKQVRFYTKNGFTPVIGKSNIYVYERKEQNNAEAT